MGKDLNSGWNEDENDGAFCCFHFIRGSFRAMGIGSFSLATCDGNIFLEESGNQKGSTIFCLGPWQTEPELFRPVWWIQIQPARCIYRLLTSPELLILSGELRNKTHQPHCPMFPVLVTVVHFKCKPVEQHVVLPQQTKSKSQIPSTNFTDLT